jgi:hypothetical protein
VSECPSAIIFVFGIGFAAQRSSANQTQSGQSTQGQGMMGMMDQMTTHHQTMSRLMNKMMEYIATIQNEKDPEALKSKLAEHQALLKQMQSQMMQQGNMMQMMSGQIKQSYPGQSGNSTIPTKW